MMNGIGARAFLVVCLSIFIFSVEIRAEGVDCSHAQELEDCATCCSFMVGANDDQGIISGCKEIWLANSSEAKEGSAKSLAAETGITSSALLKICRETRQEKNAHRKASKTFRECLDNCKEAAAHDGVTTE